MTLSELPQKEAYETWFATLKTRLQTAQLKAAVRVNTELSLIYWQLGREITEKQKEANWKDALIKQLSHDLSNAFPQMKGFSRTNLFYIRK